MPTATYQSLWNSTTQKLICASRHYITLFIHDSSYVVSQTINAYSMLHEQPSQQQVELDVPGPVVWVVTRMLIIYTITYYLNMQPPAGMPFVLENTSAAIIWSKHIRLQIHAKIPSKTPV